MVLKHAHERRDHSGGHRLFSRVVYACKSQRVGPRAMPPAARDCLQLRRRKIALATGEKAQGSYRSFLQIRAAVAHRGDQWHGGIGLDERWKHRELLGKLAQDACRCHLTSRIAIRPRRKRDELCCAVSLSNRRASILTSRGQTVQNLQGLRLDAEVGSVQHPDARSDSVLQDRLKPRGRPHKPRESRGGGPDELRPTAHERIDEDLHYTRGGNGLSVWWHCQAR